MSEPDDKRLSIPGLSPLPVPYDALEWAKKPLAERAEMVCRAWAEQGYGTPLGVFVVYLLKIGAYVGGWVLACSFSPSLGGPAEIATWWLEPLAFQKAILFSMLFEGLGLGCGSGPLTGRYFPPVGGFLYWLRPGTTKLPLFRGAPLLGGHRRTWLDVLLYAGLVGTLGWALISPTLGWAQLAPIAILTPLIGLSDKTIFLAFRSEHYWVTILVFLFAGDWIAGAMAVQLALWFFAGFSKLNHHFPGVVCVMTSNAPFTRGTPLRRWVYRSKEDLRPSRFATLLAHAGTALEMSIPLVFLFVPGELGLYLGIALALLLHTFITSNVPMGVPLEWNVMVVYGVFALFWAHPDTSVLDLGSLPLGAFLAVVLVGIPVFGNMFPERVSFLLSMRYYAGNWPYSVWLFKGESYRKLEKLVASAPWVYDQLDRFYDRQTAVGLVGKVMGFRMMHLQGRALSELIPKAIEAELGDYEYLDGEIIAGLALGWNFGDGHLHNEALLEAVQAQCGFEPGELRCIFVEGQPVHRATMDWRIADAATGRLDEGRLDVHAMRERQTWET